MKKFNSKITLLAALTVASIASSHAVEINLTEQKVSCTSTNSQLTFEGSGTITNLSKGDGSMEAPYSDLGVMVIFDQLKMISNGKATDKDPLVLQGTIHAGNDESVSFLKTMHRSTESQYVDEVTLELSENGVVTFEIKTKKGNRYLAKCSVVR